ncbi:MAG: hypothetical protein Q8O01_05670, partial [Candidatus Omnitrophota bacterium]|nr:hypothetical protein [Candidatus Omnitrophota bacterium]
KEKAILFGTNGTNKGQFDSPRSPQLFYDYNGILIGILVTEWGNHRLQYIPAILNEDGSIIFDKEKAVLFGVKGTKKGQFNYPESSQPVYDDNGILRGILVTEANNHRLQYLKLPKEEKPAIDWNKWEKIDDNTIRRRAHPTIIAKKNADGTYDVESGGLPMTPPLGIVKTQDEILGFSREAAAHEALSDKSIATNRTAVIIRRGLIDRAMAANSGGINMNNRYKVMTQDIRKRFARDNDELFRVAEDNAEITARANDLIDQGIKVIILDDGAFASSEESTKIYDTGKNNYCIVNATIPIPDEEQVFAFVNLSAMAMMGLGIVWDDPIVFETAYEIFTGRRVPAIMLEALTNGTLKVIGVLPRMVKLTPGIDQTRELAKLFEISA